MGGDGRNVPGFRAAQLDFAAHIRNPDLHPRPGDVPEARMAVYRELFYNNLEGFLASGFPLLRTLTDDARWARLVRDMLHRHPSSSPYFLDIGQEFLAYLAEARPTHPDAPDDPPWLLELAHYEWVELALDVADDEVADDTVDPGGDLADGVPVVSPLAWTLRYAWPVHRITADWQPAAAAPDPEQPTWLVVHRNRADVVGFTEANAVTVRLLELLREGGRTGREALAVVAAELGRPDDPAVVEHGLTTMVGLRDADIIAGTLRKDCP